LFDGLMTRARSKLEKGYVYERKLSLAVALGKYQDAFKLAHAALRLFNIRLPRSKAGKYFSILRNVVLMKWRFRNVRPEDLLKLPEIKNEKENLVTRIFSLAISPVYFSMILRLTLRPFFLLMIRSSGEIQFLHRIFL
jgi:hypothetical protein